jgi:hypothetical protein
MFRLLCILICFLSFWLEISAQKIIWQHTIPGKKVTKLTLSLDKSKIIFATDTTIYRYALKYPVTKDSLNIIDIETLLRISDDGDTAIYTTSNGVIGRYGSRFMYKYIFSSKTQTRRARSYEQIGPPSPISNDGNKIYMNEGRVFSVGPAALGSNCRVYINSADSMPVWGTPWCLMTGTTDSGYVLNDVFEGLYYQGYSWPAYNVIAIGFGSRGTYKVSNWGLLCFAPGDELILTNSGLLDYQTNSLIHSFNTLATDKFYDEYKNPIYKLRKFYNSRYIVWQHQNTISLYDAELKKDIPFFDSILAGRSVRQFDMRDNILAIATDSSVIIVELPMMKEFTPIIDFKSDSTSQRANQATTFSAWIYPRSIVAEYAWDFGDGITYNGLDARHVFTMPGIYPVTLKVYNNQNTLIGTVTKQIRIGNAMSINDQIPINPGSLMPQPADQFCIVHAQVQNIKALILYDNLGNAIQPDYQIVGPDQIQLQTASLSAGIYSVNILSPERMQTLLIIVMH